MLNIILILVLFIVTPITTHAGIFSKIGAFFSNGFLGSKNKIEKHEILNSEAGFFHPAMYVFSNFKNKRYTMRVGDKRFIEPSFVEVIESTCSGDNNTDPNVYFKCICARSRFLNMSSKTRNLGCFVIPQSPYPPPFCDGYSKTVSASIIPDLKSSFLYPRIKVSLGYLGMKFCDNNLVSMSSDCDGGIMEGFVTESIMIPSGGIADRNLSFNGKNIDIHAYHDVKNNQVCANIDFVDHLSSNSMFNMCYDNEPLNKPSNIVLRDINTVYFDFYGRNASLSLNSLPFKGMKLIKPSIDDNHDIQMEPMCTNGAIQIRPEIHDDVVNCPEGYRNEFVYLEDPDSSVVCIDGWSPFPEELILNKGLHSNKFYKSFGVFDKNNLFRKQQYSAVRDAWLPTGENLNIHSFSQEELDSIKLYNLDLYSITNSYGLSFYYKYEELEDNLFISVSGEVIDINDYLVESDNSVLYPKPPWMNGLCFFNGDMGQGKGNFLSTDFVYSEDYQYYEIPDKCDFVTVKAWGGGGSPMLDEGKSYHSGSAGFSVATILSNNNIARNYDNMDLPERRVLKIKVGSGSSSYKDFAESTDVFFCKNKENEECIPVLSAKGANSDGIGGYKDDRIYSDEINHYETLSGINGDSSDDTIPLSNSGNYIYSKNDAARIKNHLCNNMSIEDINKIKNKLNQENLNFDTSSLSDTSNLDPSLSSDTFVDELDGLKQEINNYKLDDNGNLIIDRDKRENYYGSGGCVNKEKGVLQYGAHGHVKLICEQWIIRN